MIPERKLIERIAREARRGRKSRALVAGIGDDCAVLRPKAGHDLVVTTDFTLEEVHFRRNWHAPAVVGHRCLTRGLSDIAAMGAEPMAAFLSLALPGDLPQSWADEFLSGLLKLARCFDVSLAGGDLAQSPDGRVLADIIVLGSVPAGKALLRSGARPGDVVYVTGKLGGAAAEIAELYRPAKGKVARVPRPINQSLLTPAPRIAIGRELRKRGIPSAMIDLSDGLSTDLDHICEMSGVGAEVDATSIPRATFAGSPVDLEMALNGGEDYELLFTAPVRVPVPKRLAGVQVTAIGRIIPGKRMFLIEDGRKKLLRARGWEHFR